MSIRIRPRIEITNRVRLESVIPLKTPFVVYVDPSDLCNFKCDFCPTANRALMKRISGRNFGPMNLRLFQKIIDDICEFEEPIKVLRLYKDGEPMMNPAFVNMVAYAKQSRCAQKIDTTINASLLTPEKNIKMIEAGLDRINISIYGVRQKQYEKFSHYRINFDKFVNNIRHLYERRGQCELIIKINGDIISREDQEKFMEIFGEIADGVYVEHIMSCWPDFNLDARGVKVNKDQGIYGQAIKEVEVCPYIFYSLSINSDGTVSICFLDWSRRMIIGNVTEESVKDIWNSKLLNNHRKIMLLKQRKFHSICGNCGQMSHGLPDDIDKYSELLFKKMI